MQTSTQPKEFLNKMNDEYPRRAKETEAGRLNETPKGSS
jgi:hypothetical protein